MDLEMFGSVRFSAEVRDDPEGVLGVEGSPVFIGCQLALKTEPQRVSDDGSDPEVGALTTMVRTVCTGN